MTPAKASPSSAAAISAYCSQPKNPRGGQPEGPTRARLRSASFHHAAAAAAHPEHRQMRRPKTQPELLCRGAATSSPTRVPAKVLVNVAVQRSLGPVQVVASTEWSVGELVAAALARYDREGRRPTLPAAEPSAFGLHYSQFSLESDTALPILAAIRPESGRDRIPAGSRLDSGRIAARIGSAVSASVFGRFWPRNGRIPTAIRPTVAGRPVEGRQSVVWRGWRRRREER
ncbi:hypothetical protein ZIOFF_066892 [Zingiber officinale]|uniref:DUF7054 domain-containing protein n=1 Tax=Zingiber officinale TaxID=94328 RepID=A0A8J5EYT6_ZINOF|nr:hypothetical protein ZIOFF_066892 [Zingiber officinale]